MDLLFLSIMILYCGIINGSNIMSKFFMCYELFYLLLIIMFLLGSFNLNDYVLLFYFFWNPTFEMMLGLSVFFMVCFSFSNLVCF